MEIIGRGEVDDSPALRRQLCLYADESAIDHS